MTVMTPRPKGQLVRVTQQLRGAQWELEFMERDRVTELWLAQQAGQKDQGTNIPVSPAASPLIG